MSFIINPYRFGGNGLGTPDLLTNLRYVHDMDGVSPRYGGTNLSAGGTLTTGVTGLVAPSSSPEAYQYDGGYTYKYDAMHNCFRCNYNASRAFAFEFWFKFKANPSSYSGTHNLTSNDNGTWPSYPPTHMKFGCNFNTMQWSLKMSKSPSVHVIPYFTFGAIPDDTNWHQVVMVFDTGAEYFDFWLDYNKTSFGASIFDNTSTSYVGVSGEGLQWEGDKTVLDVWRAWTGFGTAGKTKALDVVEVYNLWNGGAGLDYDSFV